MTKTRVNVPTTRLGSSFRDPSGHVIADKGILKRTISASYIPIYRKAEGSGLYDRLMKDALLIPHRELPRNNRKNNLVIQPDVIPFISYPYEWCFGELHDAALTTLNIQKTALAYGFSLKDASAYNIQFYNGKPILIDTLSFEPYVAGSPWIAYRQFCMHFLMPLLLMSRKSADFNKLFITHLDGIPLSLGSSLLPKTTLLNPSLLAHIHLHAMMEQKLAGNTARHGNNTLSKDAFVTLLNNLESTIRHLKLRDSQSQWSSYEETHSYGVGGMREKKKIVTTLLRKIHAESALDIGANTGAFTALCIAGGINTIAVDNDHGCIEKLYAANKRNNVTNCLPLCIDITNPSPSIGWENNERSSFLDRTDVDLVLALALIHHIAIGNNVPFDYIARLMSRLGRYLIIEFVPKTDIMVRQMLANRVDVFTNYTKKLFEREFSVYFRVLGTFPVLNTGRVIYLMERKRGV
ncbi:MAG TPA: SAM-dependent methyltransferase [Patescibacteria group bacterium]|nr:SAM-dependent methyltransferase [Patescibacteria group bacterium]